MAINLPPLRPELARCSRVRTSVSARAAEGWWIELPASSRIRASLIAAAALRPVIPPVETVLFTPAHGLSVPRCPRWDAWTYLYRSEYLSGMENVAVHLPRQLVEQVDEAARDEMRSRSNLVRLLVTEGLRRREPADPEQEAS
jgi:CopG-like RHH_1 or ribbon-helix-helix domain, RHH_5